MNSFLNVILGLMVVSVLAVACNRSSDSTAAVGKGAGRGTQGKAGATGKGQQGKSAIDTSQLTEAQKKSLELISRDVDQLRKMAHGMNRLFTQLWIGYWKDHPKTPTQISSVNNVFQLLETVLKNNYDDNSVPLKSPFQTPGKVVALPAEATKVTVIAGQESVRRGGPGPGAKPQPAVPTCKGEVYSFEQTSNPVVKKDDKTVTERTYRLAFGGCNGENLRVLANVFIKVALDGVTRYTEIQFNQLELSNELGAGLQFKARRTPYCHLFAKEDGTTVQVNCQEIGQNQVKNSKVFVAMDSFKYSSKSTEPLSGEWQEFEIGDDGKPQLIAKSKIIDSMKDGEIIFQQLPLKPIGKIPDSPAQEQIPPPDIPAPTEEGKPTDPPKTEGTPVPAPATAPVGNQPAPAPATGESAAPVTGEPAVPIVQPGDQPTLLNTVPQDGEGAGDIPAPTEQYDEDGNLIQPLPPPGA